ncbi:hypothetical protein MTR67_007217 [Solanum verrucosum]|uniref:Uncharacterized protein n=1 Tax=Solanum verrucosum TaxID=315347 RepID=A0AAF0PZT8_SOLVR|nr:hypothetical protein MTR67_007217 [Solanum verrucosum]
MLCFAMINLESRKKVLLVKLNSKLEAAVEKRIEVLNMVNNGHWVIGDVAGSVEINGDAMAAEFWGSFSTLVNQQTLTNDSFMALKPNYDYSIPFSTGSF